MKLILDLSLRQKHVLLCRLKTLKLWAQHDNVVVKVLALHRPGSNMVTSSNPSCLLVTWENI